MTGRLALMRSQVAKTVRRGSRSVLLTPCPGPRFGNFLYYWLHAFIVQETGKQYRVQIHDHLEPWLGHLRGIDDELCVRGHEVRPLDRREWPPISQFQGYGVEFGTHEIRAFVRHYLKVVPQSSNEGKADELLVINVRRGDYYREAKFRKLYGFNVLAYIEVALRRSMSVQKVSSVRVVSDDLAWCQSNMGELLRAAGVRDVSYGAREPGGWGDFLEIARARRLIGANSTFSYWGAYVSTVRYGTEAHIQMPRFVSRHPANADGLSPLLPQWDIVESIPGGWGPPPSEELSR